VEAYFRALVEDKPKSESQNPFGVTKSDDFTDAQIYQFWIEPGEASADQLIKPCRPMPMFVIGGKGSGKTHLLRHFSYAVRSIQIPDSPIKQIEADKYFGVYVRCDGLNATRFVGKSQSEDTWLAIFEYFLELWLAQVLLTQISEVFQKSPQSDVSQAAVSRAVCQLFDEAPDVVPESLEALRELLRSYQREIDIAINNLPLTRKLSVRIRTGPSKLIFGLPRIFAEMISGFAGVTFVYLLDELENLSLTQQKYIHTLVRHRQGNCTFRIGARLYGIKTVETLIEGEVNREGAEFDVLELDAYWRSKKHYTEFCEMLVAGRLQGAGYKPSGNRSGALRESLRSFFDEPASENFYREYTLALVSNYKPLERPYLVRFRQNLARHAVTDRRLRVKSDADVTRILRLVAVGDFPLLEKLNVFLVYQAWARRDDLPRFAAAVQKQCKAFLKSKGKQPKHYFSAYQHFSGDMLAQLSRETGNRVRYAGFDTYIKMSSGLPRNLLIILKDLFDWAIFNGEVPFNGQPVSMETQEQAVLEACSWFFEEARPNHQADLVQHAIERLATLFREIRYSDKPSECSVSTFSCSTTSWSPKSRELLKLAQDWSMLIRQKRGQRDRNSERVDEKYQLSPMLAPKWDLPLSRRGALVLNGAEIDAIFGELSDENFQAVRQNRIARMNAPFRGDERNSDQQTTLPGFS
jgi:hypothetical protein